MSELDPELKAMATIITALDELTEAQRARIVEWLAKRLEVEVNGYRSKKHLPPPVREVPIAEGSQPPAQVGETMQVHIKSRGRKWDQGIGHDENGNVIYVDGAAAYIGRPIKFKVSQVLPPQPNAGRRTWAVFGSVQMPSANKAVLRTSHWDLNRLERRGSK